MFWSVDEICFLKIYMHVPGSLKCLQRVNLSTTKFTYWMHPYICHNHNYIIVFYVNVYTPRALDWWINTLYTCICLIKINLHIMVVIIILSYLHRDKRINQAYSFFSYQIHVKLSLVSQCMLLTTSIAVHKTINPMYKKTQLD